MYIYMLACNWFILSPLCYHGYLIATVPAQVFWTVNLVSYNEIAYDDSIEKNAIDIWKNASIAW